MIIDKRPVVTCTCVRSVLQVHGAAVVQLVAQVLGHEAIALDDGQPAQEPATVGGPAAARELRGTRDVRGRRVGREPDLGTGGDGG